MLYTKKVLEHYDPKEELEGVLKEIAAPYHGLLLDLFLNLTVDAG